MTIATATPRKSVVKGIEVEVVADGYQTISTHPASVKFTRGAYKGQLNITRSPTANCQLCCVGPIQQLLAFTAAKEEQTALMQECFRLIGHKPLLVLFDAKSDAYWKMIREAFTVKFEWPYTSTNGSAMRIFLVTMPDAKPAVNAPVIGGSVAVGGTVSVQPPPQPMPPPIQPIPEGGPLRTQASLYASTRTHAVPPPASPPFLGTAEVREAMEAVAGRILGGDQLPAQAG